MEISTLIYTSSLTLQVFGDSCETLISKGYNHYTFNVFDSHPTTQIFV